MPPVSRRGDLQRLADRLDPELVSVLIDELSHVLKRRSSSAWAKNALAKRRISLALRNSRTSRSSALTRSCSAVLGPSRWPVSRSCWRTHRRSVSAVQPIFAAIDTIAAHCDAYSSLDSATIRTARSMTSGENFDDLFMMAPFSQMMEPPSNPGRFTSEHMIEDTRRLLRSVCGSYTVPPQSIHEIQLNDWILLQSKWRCSKNSCCANWISLVIHNCR